MNEGAKALAAALAPLLVMVDEVLATTRADGSQRFRGRVGARKVFEVIVPPARHLQMTIPQADGPRGELAALRESLVGTTRRVKAPPAPAEAPAPPEAAPPARRRVTRRTGPAQTAPAAPPPVAPTPAQQSRAEGPSRPLPHGVADALAPKRGAAVVWREKPTSLWERLADTLPIDALWELARGGAQARRYLRGRCIEEVGHE